MLAAQVTLLVSWVAVDTHGTSSAYIVSDSRISWNSGSVRFDLGRKVFAFGKWPDVLGYSGDVLFPSIALNQIVQIADEGLLFSSSCSSQEKRQAIFQKLAELLNSYPKSDPTIMGSSFDVIHVSRDPVDHKMFSFGCISWSRSDGWSTQESQVPDISRAMYVLGSGSEEFRRNYLGYEKGPNSGTSRNVFHCFCETLLRTKDQNLGGAPQLVGIYRKPNSPALNFGVIKDRHRFFLGASVGRQGDLYKIEWRNGLFERCDPGTMSRLERSQSQPDLLSRL